MSFLHITDIFIDMVKKSVPNEPLVMPSRKIPRKKSVSQRVMFLVLQRCQRQSSFTRERIKSTHLKFCLY